MKDNHVPLGHRVKTLTFSGNRKCPLCGGRLKDITEPDEGVRVFECQICGKTFDQGQING